MGKYVSVIGGLVVILLGVMGLIRWLPNFVSVLKATVPCILILGGLIALAAGISEVKDSLKVKEETKETK
ncbi:MAG: hypothetical protein WCG78_01260 [Candidatus Omnitrophota bacterium]